MVGTNRNDLDRANADLGQPKQRPAWFWAVVITAIVVGAVIVLAVAALALLFFLRSSASPTYPFIPTPKNTLRSANRHELLLNMMQDAGDEGVKYSVISRRDLAQ